MTGDAQSSRDKGWTDESRAWVVAQFKAGVSCSIIAARLARQFPDLEPKTRNAVIGVVNRAGCGRDHRSPHYLSKSSTKVLRQKRVAKAAASPSAPVSVLAGKPDPEMLALLARKEEIEIPIGERMTLLVLDDTGRLHANDRFTSSCCRWPIGDPREVDFHFCGKESVPGVVYCEFHARRAFGVPAVRRSSVGVVSTPVNTNTPASDQRRATEDVLV